MIASFSISKRPSDPTTKKEDLSVKSKTFTSMISIMSTRDADDTAAMTDLVSEGSAHHEPGYLSTLRPYSRRTNIFTSRHFIKTCLHLHG